MSGGRGIQEAEAGIEGGRKIRRQAVSLHIVINSLTNQPKNNKPQP